jgi:hypothetical protein
MSASHFIGLDASCFWFAKELILNAISNHFAVALAEGAAA